MVTNKEKINILINKYKKYVKTILNASPDEVEKLNSLSDTEAFSLAADVAGLLSDTPGTGRFPVLPGQAVPASLSFATPSPAQ